MRWQTRSRDSSVGRSNPWVSGARTRRAPENRSSGIRFLLPVRRRRIVVDDTVEHVIPQSNRTGVVSLNYGGLRPRVTALRTPVRWPTTSRTGSTATAPSQRVWWRATTIWPSSVCRCEMRQGASITRGRRGSVTAALSRLAENIHRPLPGNFQSMPDFRVFVDRDLFLVKPIGKRFWPPVDGFGGRQRHRP